MPTTIQAFPQKQADPPSLDGIERWLPWLLFGSAVLLLFFNLGSAPLFEPDEGRNAEKAREILVLNDWITPHENFYPVLDKPMFFYWLIALAYKIFGVTAWAARLPSALAALSCAGLIYYFVRRRWGLWPALWSTWILLSSAGFFVLARVVIFDMTLTLFLTLALCAFYEAVHADDLKRRRILCLVLYASLAAATLIKGLIGVVVPGMVFFFYLWITSQWSLLRKIYLIPGAMLFLLLVLPWYLQADAANPGYLRYYFWDEHFGRYAGDDFNRGEPWHFFIWMVMAGLFPWTIIVPFAVKRYGKLALDDKTIYVILWFVLPFLFFSASTSKLPHYILPILPAASILIAVPLVNLFHVFPSRAKFALSMIALFQAVIVLYVVFGSFWPAALPRAIRAAVAADREFLLVYGTMITIFFLFIVSRAKRRPTSRCRFYLTHVASLVLFLIFVTEVMVLTAPGRSAKLLAEISAPQITASTQLVFYDTYRSGMAFYLRTERPIWMVTHSNKKRTFLGNFYALTDREVPTNHWGAALLDFEEFQEKLRTTHAPMLVIVKDKNLPRLEEQIGTAATKIGAVGEYLILSKL